MRKGEIPEWYYKEEIVIFYLLITRVIEVIEDHVKRFSDCRIQTLRLLANVVRTPKLVSIFGRTGLKVGLRNAVKTRK